MSAEVLEQLAAALETLIVRQRRDVYGLSLPSDASYIDLLKAVNESVGLPLALFAPRLIPAIVNVLRITENDGMRVELLDLLPKILDSCSSTKAMRGWDDETARNVSTSLASLEVGNANARFSSSLGSFSGLIDKYCGGKIPGDTLADLKMTSEKLKATQT